MRPRSGDGWIKTSNLLSTRSRYDAFRQIVAQRLEASDDDVDLFSVVNHPTQPRTDTVLDHFKDRSSPWSDPVLDQFRN